MLMALHAEKAGSGTTFYGLEHDERFVRSVRDLLGSHHIDGYNLLHAPLTAQRVGDWRGDWYAPAAVAALPPTIDMLVIDGPPNWRGSGARAPALDLLADRLMDGTIVVVDDTDRYSEAEMLRRWVDDGVAQLLVLGDGYAVLRVRKAFSVGDVAGPIGNRAIVDAREQPDSVELGESARQAST